MTKKFCTYVVMSTETDEVLLVGFSKTNSTNLRSLVNKTSGIHGINLLENSQKDVFIVYETDCRLRARQLASMLFNLYEPVFNKNVIIKHDTDLALIRDLTPIYLDITINLRAKIFDDYANISVHRTNTSIVEFKGLHIITTTVVGIANHGSMYTYKRIDNSRHRNLIVELIKSGDTTLEEVSLALGKTKGSVYSWIKDYNTNNFLITLDDSDDIP